MSMPETKSRISWLCADNIPLLAPSLFTTTCSVVKSDQDFWQSFAYPNHLRATDFRAKKTFQSLCLCSIFYRFLPYSLKTFHTYYFLRFEINI